MRNLFSTPQIDTTPEHEVMPPQRSQKAAGIPPATPPIEIPAPVGISLMC